MKLNLYRNLTIGLLSLFLVTSLHSCQDKETDNSRTLLNSGWKFKLLDDPTVLEKFDAVDFDDSNWENVDLPHTAHLEPLVVNDQWQGICWYRKAIEVPNYTKGKRITIAFEAAMNQSTIWVNGKEVAMHNGGYLPVVLDVTDYVTKGQKNIIAVQLNNMDNPITGPKPLKRLDFNMYGGLYRNVWLTVTDEVRISHPVLANKVAGGGVFVTYPKVSEEESVVNVKTNIVNHGNDTKAVELVQSIFYKDQLIDENKTEKANIEGGNDMDIIDQFTLSKANLWSPGHPHLYHLKTQVLLNGKVVDEKTTRFGIREFAFEDNQLYINGKKTFLRGVNRHQEYPFIGYALSDNAQYRDAKKIKDGGFDYVRLSHYPHSTAFMNACDELGLVVIDAIMGWQFYNDTDEFREYCYRSATELIRRDRNHPSVMAWEVSLNETKTMPIYFMEKLHEITHAEYPGENVYSCGWKDDVYDIYLEARQHRILRPHPYKDKPITVSEYGDWEYYSKNAGLNQDKLSNDLRVETSSRQARGYGEERMLIQAKNVQEAHNDNLGMRAYSDSYWVMFDYNRGYHDDIEQSGLMDIFRLPKFAYYFYRSQKNTEDAHVLKIASYWNDKSPLAVKVYSNAETVELYLNEKLIATQKPDKNEISTNLVHPPFSFNLPAFETGTLKAIGFSNGKEVSQDIVRTPQKPIKLKIWLDEAGKATQSGVNDAVFLRIAAVDENGTINPDFSEIITFDTNGDSHIMNLGEIKAEAGIASALIRIGKSTEPIIISATSKNLKGNLQVELQ